VGQRQILPRPPVKLAAAGMNDLDTLDQLLRLHVISRQGGLRRLAQPPSPTLRPLRWLHKNSRKPMDRQEHLPTASTFYNAFTIQGRAQGLPDRPRSARRCWACELDRLLAFFVNAKRHSLAKPMGSVWPD